MRGFAGYTLTEMLIVAAILAAAASVAVPLLSSPDPDRVELAAVQLVQALRFARSQAELTRVPHGVRIDAATDRVQLFRLDMGTLPPTHDFSVRHPVQKDLFVLDYPNERSTRGVQIGSVALQFAATCGEARDVVFDDRGRPLCSASLAIELTGGDVELTNGRTVRRVSIAAVTGRVVVQ